MQRRTHGSENESENDDDDDDGTENGENDENGVVVEGLEPTSCTQFYVA